MTIGKKGMEMETVVLGLFGGALLLCLLSGVSILWALAAGWFLFAAYARHCGQTFGEVLRVSVFGISAAKNILITFFLIGMLTALWREAGTIACMVCIAVRWISPADFLVMTFGMNCVLSVMTGTAFGTAATMGVICGVMGTALGVSPVWVGGAVLSGVYFGDRCSLVSTSALLVATLTRTDIFENIKAMMRTAAVPLLATCGVYAVVGCLMETGGDIPDFTAVFGAEFNLSQWTLLPAAVLLALSLVKVNVKRAMTASILSAIPVCVFLQHTPLETILPLLFTGFVAEHVEVAALLNGGGMVSMGKVAAIVCISSAYSGIFQSTGILKCQQVRLQKLAKETTSFFAISVASVMTSMLACNQTLAIMLTHQLACEAEPNRNRFAIALENSVVVIAPLVPWSIAGTVPLASMEAPTESILCACFLYFLPLWETVRGKK